MALTDNGGDHAEDFASKWAVSFYMASQLLPELPAEWPQIPAAAPGEDQWPQWWQGVGDSNFGCHDRLVTLLLRRTSGWMAALPADKQRAAAQRHQHDGRGHSSRRLR